MVEPVRDRLADIHRDRKNGKPPPDLGGDGVALASAGLQADLQIGGMDPFGMLVELGAARAATDLVDLGDLHQQALGDGADASGFRERDAGGEGGGGP